MADTNNFNLNFNLNKILFVVFLILKLTGNIDWSWWWVTSPLWIPFVLVSGFLFLVLALIIVCAIIDAIFN